MKKIVKISLSIILGLIGVTALIAPPVFAADDVCSKQGVVPDEVYEAAGCSGNKNELQSAITSILSAIIGVVGLISVIYIIIGGIQYMSSSGDPSKIKKAKKTILYACIGLIISALAFIIVNFVINNILGQAQTTEEEEETSPTSLIELPIAFSEK